jgi:hypothetical protein
MRSGQGVEYTIVKTFLSIIFSRKYVLACDVFPYVMALGTKRNELHHKHIGQNHFGHLKPAKVFAIF